MTSTGAPPAAPGPRTFVYGVGGGGDIGVACAFIHGKSRAGTPGAEGSFVAVGAGYSLPQYRGALTAKIPGREDDWLRLLFSNLHGAPPDPRFYLVRHPFDRAAVDAIWGPGADARPAGFKYLTGLDELFVRGAMALSCPLALVLTAASGRKYLASDGLPCDTEAALASERAACLEGSCALLEAFGAGPDDEHVLLDVGGDVADIPRRGRDTLFLLELLNAFSALGAAAPRLSVVVLGLGCDGHAPPAEVAARLARLGFREVREGSAGWADLVAPLLSGLDANRAALADLQLLGSHKRATQLFLDARAGREGPFTYSDDRKEREESIFARGEIAVRAAPGAGPEEAAAAAAAAEARAREWREVLGEPGSERRAEALRVMRQVWVLEVGPGEAGAVRARWAREEERAAREEGEGAAAGGVGA